MSLALLICNLYLPMPQQLSTEHRNEIIHYIQDNYKPGSTKTALVYSAFCHVFGTNESAWPIKLCSSFVTDICRKALGASRTDTSVLATIRKKEQEIKSLLRELEAERDGKQQELLELDSVISYYSKLTRKESL